jgi:RNA polymerase sigma factor (sigma-70 family)
LIGVKFVRDRILSSAEHDNTTLPEGFVTKRWNLILSAIDSKRTDEREIRAALAALCRIYWRPIFFFVARHGYSPEDAEDLTQDFFLRIIKADWLQKVDPNRGRFRSLLLKSVQNFLRDAAKRTNARKRGGDVSFISWDPWMTEARSELAVAREALNSWPAERLSDAGWAATVVQRAIRRLREECERKGRLRIFEVLSPHLSAEWDNLSYTRLAAKLQVPKTTLKKLLCHMRQRYRFLLRDEVAQTVAGPVDVEAELRYLCCALAARSAAAA